MSVLRGEYGEGEGDPVDGLCDAKRGGAETGRTDQAKGRNSEKEQRTGTAGESLKAARTGTGRQRDGIYAQERRGICEEKTPGRLRMPWGWRSYGFLIAGIVSCGYLHGLFCRISLQENCQ